MFRVMILFAAVSGFIYQALGAFSGHVIQNEQAIRWVKTGLQYQGFYTLVLLFLALLFREKQNRFYYWSSGLMVAGIFLFSGSLYLLSLLQNTLFSYFTPIGGICFLLGWCSLFIGAWVVKKGDS